LVKHDPPRGASGLEASHDTTSLSKKKKKTVLRKVTGLALVGVPT